MDINTIYRALPRSLQNLALTLYGYKQHGLRYGQALPEPYSRRELHGAIDFVDVRRWQAARFAELVEHAATYVPYYRDLFAARGIKPGTLTLDNFREHIPVLSKREVVAAPERFHSTYFQSGALSLFTSGTSGSPMPIRCALQARAINYAFYRSLLLQHGCDVRDRSATFAGRLLLGGDNDPVVFRKDFYNKTLYLSSYHINEQNMAAYIRALEEWQPLYIDSYPSAVALLADYIVRNSITHAIRLKFVLTSSETLTAQQRETIGAAFACPVVDHYGCTEMAVSASSGAAGMYRIDSLYSLVEFAPSAAPDSRQLVCTGLLNFAMPLIRFAIGDVVNGVVESAATPFYNQTFTEIAGREDDVIVTSDGRIIGRMDPVFKGLSGISQAQIIQRATTEIEVLVVAAFDADRDDVIATLTQGIRQRTAADMQVSVQFVAAIPLSKSGKFKSVVSMMPKVSAASKTAAL